METVDLKEGHVLTPEEDKLAHAPISKLILSYSGPSIFSMLIMSIYNIVDQIFIGNGVGYLGNGATNVVYPITVAATALSMLFASGSAAYFSLRLGEKRHKEAEKAVGSAAISVFVVISILSILAGIFMEPIFWLFGCTDEILPYALEYGKIIIWGLPFVSTIMVLSGLIRSDGNPKIAMLSMLCGAVFNTILDPIFIFVFHWGVSGAAIATVMSELLGFVITILYIPHFKTIKLTWKSFIPDFKVLGGLCALGASSCISQAAMLFLMGLLNRSYIKYGEMTKYGASIPLTCVGVVSKFNQILTSLANGTNAGAQPIIGYNYGAGNLDRVRKTYKTALMISTGFMLIGTIIFEIFPDKAIALFGQGSDLYNEFATKCLRIFMLIMVFNGVQASVTSFFQAIGKPMRAMLLSSLRQIVLLLPAILILPLFWGLDGVLWAAPVADLFAFIIATCFIVNQWKTLNRDGIPKNY